MPESSTSRSPAGGLSHRLDAASWGPAHTRILVGLGVGWALVAFEVQILGSVITPLAGDFGLLDADGSVAAGPYSAIWVLWVLGLLVGATVFGWLTDRVGRRRLFVATLVVYALATLATALSPSFAVFLVFRFITAVGVGGEYAAVTSAMTEFAPARRRGGAVALTLNFWAVGGVVAGFVGLVALSRLTTGALALGGVDLAGWRVALCTGVLGAGYALAVRRRVPESPRWLVAHGRIAEADAIVRELGGAGTAPVTPSITPAPRPSFAGQIAEVWRAGRSRVLYGMVLDFSGSGAYYGLFTFVAAYVLTTERIGIASSTVPVFNLVANLGALAGGVAAAITLDRAGRAPTVITSFTGAAGACILLALSALAGSPVLTMITFVLSAFAATCCWISAYATFAELFPTPRRATGVGLCVGAGRLGGMLGVVGLSFATSALGLLPAFLLLAAFFAAGAVAGLVWRRLGTEGAQQPLDDLDPVPAGAG